MKKADKIKICREFMRGEPILAMVFDIEGGKPDLFDSDLADVEKALRYGLKHPEELKK